MHVRKFHEVQDRESGEHEQKMHVKERRIGFVMLVDRMNRLKITTC